MPCDMYVCEYQCLCLKEEQKYLLVDIANINLDRITQMKYNVLWMNSNTLLKLSSIIDYNGAFTS